MADDTIFALSSGLPPAGVAVVRVSGSGVRFGLETLIDSVPEPRRAILRSVRARDGGIIDRALVLFFPRPASFTGEDVAELHLHGGRAVVAAALAALAALPGFRPAEPGEFTRRAFANQRMDLTQVEGLADLIAAETEGQRRQALRQADGALGRQYESWRIALVQARALIEAELDFAEEEDIPGGVSVQSWDIVRGLEKEIVNHLADRRGERLRDGAEIVILGPPNAGKSSLLNAIAKRDVAIVTAEPGTTRDLIEVKLDLSGYPVTLVDTAGLRETDGLVEREGIRRAEARAGRADVVVWLVDMTVSGPVPPPFPGMLLVATKLDKIDSEAERKLLSNGFDAAVSAVTGDGVNELLGLLSKRISAEIPPTESPLITRSRHRSALEDCLQAMRAALAGTAEPIELRAEELRRAGEALARITGRIDVEDMLEVIFREFCVGK
jgi:tRNA modification GTPase